MVNSVGEKIKPEDKSEKNIVLFSKKVLMMNNVVRYEIKKLDFTPEIGRFLVY